MNSIWTRHLKTEEEKVEFENRIKSARTILKRLNEIVDQELRQAERASLDVKSYELNSWAYFQADLNGFKRFGRIMNNLLDLDQKDN